MPCHSSAVLGRDLLVNNVIENITANENALDKAHGAEPIKVKLSGLPRISWLFISQTIQEDIRYLVYDENSRRSLSSITQFTPSDHGV